MELAESGMRYTQMPHVMEVGYIINFLKNAYQPHFFLHAALISSQNPPLKLPYQIIRFYSKLYIYNFTFVVLASATDTSHIKNYTCLACSLKPSSAPPMFYLCGLIAKLSTQNFKAPLSFSSCLMVNVLCKTENGGVVNSHTLLLPWQPDCRSGKINIISVD